MTKPPTFIRKTSGPYTIWLREGVNVDPVVASIQTPGNILKESPKATTWQSGQWVVKQSSARPRMALKQIVAGKARQSAFDAALFLEKHNIAAPHAIAYVERRIFGLAFQSWVITEFLDGCVDVEAYLDRMIEDKARNDDIKQYLAGIANAVNALVKARAQHRDLAGKNILTRDGETFYFIDLDAVSIGRGYPHEDRLKNHVQLYDSFCDRINDTYLEPFIAKMGTTTENIAMYMGAVKKAQKVRRARTEAIWRKNGR